MSEKTETTQTEGISANALDDETFFFGDDITSDDGQAFQLAQATDGAATEEETAEAAESTEGTDAAQPAAPAPQAIVQVEIDADGSVRLPAGTSLAQAQVSGDDLRLIQPDGTVYVIVGAISNVPNIFIGDVQIPAQTLADALAAQGINIAAPGDAGTENPDSSGNNFQATHPGISPAFDLTPLQPLTELANSVLTQPELLEPLPQENEPPVVGTAALRVSEEGLPFGNPDELGSDDTTNSTTAAGTLPVTDPDGDPLTITLGEPMPSLTSHDHNILWNGIDTNALTGYVDENDNGIIDAGDTPIIFITIDNLGNIDVAIEGHVDHPFSGSRPEEEDDLDLTVPVFVDDGEFIVESNFIVTIEDDSPLVIVDGEPIVARVYESGLNSALEASDISDGNPDNAADIAGASDETDSSIFGSLTALVSGGADADASFSIDTDLTGADLPPLFSQGDPVTYSVSPDGTTLTAEAGGRTVFTLTVNADGSWIFDLDDQLDHVAGSGENFQLVTAADGSSFVESIDFSLVINVSDVDGDSVSVNFPDAFKIFVQDDIPVVNPQGRIAVTVDEDGLTGANIDSSKPGEFDGGGSTTATGLAGALNALVSDGADENVEFDLSVDNNADGAALVAALGLTSNGFNVDDAVVSENVITARSSDGRGIFRLTINTDGSYQVELLDQVDQPSNSVEDSIAIDLSDFIAAIDFDGDPVPLGEALFLVTIFDDIPSVDITDTDPSSVIEGDTITGTWNDTPGADQPATIKVVVDGAEHDLGAGIPVEVGGQTVGTLTVASDGTWEFVSNPDVDQSDDDPQFTFTIRITDADGDVNEDSHAISVLDGTIPRAGTLILQVEEQALDTDATGDDDSSDLAPGNVTGTNADLLAETASGNLQFTAGSDNIISFAFADPAVMAPTVLDADGVVVPVTWSIVGGQLIGQIGGVTAIIIDFTAPASIASGTSDNVAVTATLTDAFPHASPAQPDADLATISDIKIIASDGDDEATGVVTVKIVDDIPTLSVEAGVEGTSDASGLALNVDETVGDDRANPPEVADGNGDDDLVVPVDEFLGQATTAIGVGEGGLTDLFAVGGDAGSDGELSLVDDLRFVFPTDTGGDPLVLATNLTATDGGAIELHLSADGQTISGIDSVDSSTVFTIAIVLVSGEPQLQLTQFEAIDHDAAPGTDETPDVFDEVVSLLLGGNDVGSVVQLEYEVTRTDNDGDSITVADQIDLIGGGEGAPNFFSFDDDGPVNNAVKNEALLVHEDALDSTNPGVLSDGYRENAGQTSIAYITATMLAALVDFGTDGAGAFGLNSDISGDTGLNSKGVDVLYNFNAGAIEGVAGVRVVFTVAEVTNGSPEYDQAVIDSVIADGEQLFKFTLLDQVDNDDNNDLTTGEGDAQTETFDLAGAFIASDGDGDAIVLNSGLPVSIENDIPVVGFVQDAIVANVVGSVNGALEIASGADEPLLVQFADSLTSPFDGVTYIFNADRTLLEAQVDGTTDNVFSVELNQDGTYTFNLFEARPVTFEPLNFNAVTAGGPKDVLEVPTADGQTIVVFNGVDFSSGDVLNFETDNDDGLPGNDADGNALVNPNTIGFGINNGNMDDDEGFRATFEDSLGNEVSVDGVQFEFITPSNSNPSVQYEWVAYNDGVAVAASGGDPLNPTLLTASGINDPGGSQVIIIPGVEFDAIDVRVEEQSNQSVRIQNFGIVQQSVPTDEAITFDVIGTDFDGDAVTTSFDVTLKGGDPDGSFTITGTDDPEAILGGELGDTLDGAGGNDTHTGGSGSDTFVISDALSVDDITDYLFADGDAVDLTALFEVDTNDLSGATDDLGDFVTVSSNSLMFDADGDDGGDGIADAGEQVTIATLNTLGGVNIIYTENGADATDVIV